MRRLGEGALRRHQLLSLGLAAILRLTGCGGFELRPAEVRLEPAGLTQFVEVATGPGELVCARTASGRVGCFDWYSVRARAMDNAPSGFRWLGDVERATQLSVGDDYGCAIVQPGALRCFGHLPEGLLGSRPPVNQAESMALPSELGPVAQVSAGREHLCIALRSGAVECAGGNSKAQLGDGTTEKRQGWVRVQGLPGARGVVVGERHSCALVEGGSVHCWGDNSGGQLGDGTQTDSRQPVTVKGIPPLQALVGGAQHMCGITDERRLVCWGHNQLGQRGVGGTAWKGGATMVPLSGPVDLVSSADSQACAAIGGQVSCWGSSSSDWFWGGDYLERSERAATPAPKPALDGAVHISSSYQRVCAIVSKGRLVCDGTFDHY